MNLKNRLNLWIFAVPFSLALPKEVVLTVNLPTYAEVVAFLLPIAKLKILSAPQFFFLPLTNKIPYGFITNYVNYEYDLIKLEKRRSSNLSINLTF